MKAIIIGLGKSGKCAMYALSELGCELAVQDSKEADKIEPEIREFCRKNAIEEFYGSMPEDFCGYDMMVLSPGVDPERDFVERARACGTEIVGELELAYRLAKGQFVGITGTNGKTTTTTLVGEIFKAAGLKTHVVGNIGLPVISVAQGSGEDDWMITEVSSFQLQTVSQFRPRVSAILNLTPDHLNRHHTMELYGQAKAAIWKNQDENDFLIINTDDPVLMKLCLGEDGKRPAARIIPFSRKTEPEVGAFLDGTELVIKDTEGMRHRLIDRSELKIIGDHNVENALAASAVCFFAGIEPRYITETLRKFAGVEHRLEFVTETGGVKYYNDSKGTNTDASLIAIKALEKDIILIAGGDAKMQDFTDFARELEGRVKKVLLFGRDAGMIRDAMDKAGYSAYEDYKNLDECVEAASRTAVPGDKVLLSPACASWDMYPRFEVRGEHFKACVKKLEEK